MKMVYSEAIFDILIAMPAVVGAGFYILNLGSSYGPMSVVAVGLVAVAAGSRLLAPAGSRLIAGLIKE